MDFFCGYDSISILQYWINYLSNPTVQFHIKKYNQIFLYNINHQNNT